MSALARIEAVLASGQVPETVRLRALALIQHAGPWRCQHVRLVHVRPGSVRFEWGEPEPHGRDFGLPKAHTTTLLALLRGGAMPPPREEK